MFFEKGVPGKGTPFFWNNAVNYLDKGALSFLIDNLCS